LRELEERFATELVVVGVHSGKYHAERVTSRIRDASLRLGAEHPVVNDRQFRIWRSYAVSAWPTLIVVDPFGYVIGAHAGEFTADMLAPFIRSAVAAAESRGSLERSPSMLTPDVPNQLPGRLRFPGKVALGKHRIAVADSGNHRVLLGTLSENGKVMNVEREIGSGKRGFSDGANSSFDSPQGMSFGKGVLYLADSGNHAIRSIDLNSGNVSTIAGTGRQLRARRDMEDGTLSSPWDLALRGNTLYIAMAGTHQIWSLEVPDGKPMVHAGTGGEEIRDGINNEALLAQPMGIVASSDSLYFADAETSAVRRTTFGRDGETDTVVGTGLFDFGDVDGSGDEVRMQHPQGIALSEQGRLLVADSYNDSLKWLDPATRSVTTWLRGFSEPGGVAIGSDYIYVADTNAHRIVTVKPTTREVGELILQ
jgi:hypothetical protein